MGRMSANPADEPDHPPHHCKRRAQGFHRLTRPRSTAGQKRAGPGGLGQPQRPQEPRHARFRGRPAVARGRLPAGLSGTRVRGIQTAGIRPAATGTSRTPPRCLSVHSSCFPAAGSLTSARLQEPHSSCVRCRHAGGSGGNRRYCRGQSSSSGLPPVEACRTMPRSVPPPGRPRPAFPSPPAPSGAPASALSSRTVARRRFG